MATKAERSAETRQALMAAGRALFAERGFAGTSTESLVRTAGVTRGALYHHFRDKADLFRAVYEQLEQELVTRLVTEVKGVTNPVEALRRGSAAFLDACLDPAVQRVVLVEGPTVLGWERWREIDQAYGLGLVRAALEAAMDAGAVPRVPVEPLAHILLGGLVEGGMVLATASDPRRVRKEVGEAVDLLVDGLAAGRQRRPRATTRR
jgi:AcrR family transcriptional regulator